MPRAFGRRPSVARAFADAGCAVDGALPKRNRMFREGHDDRHLSFRQPFL